MQDAKYIFDPISKNGADSHSYYPFIVRMTFFIYMFFIFFGTNKPFGTYEVDMSTVGSTNMANQIIYSALLLISASCLVVKRCQLWEFVKREKYLTFFLAWSLVTILWSDYAFVSLKRWLQVLCTVTVSLAFLLNMKDKDEFLTYFKWLLAVYIILTFLSILFIPAAYSEKHQAWRGLSVGKNFLGQIAVISILFWVYMLKSKNSKWPRLSFFMLVLSLILLVGARSMSSILTFSIILFLAILLFSDNFFSPLGVGRAYSGMVIACLAGIAILLIFYTPEFVDTAFSLIGKDQSFTGRTWLWADIYSIAKSHILFGCGFSGFWVDNSPALQSIYQEYVWLPNEAHLGYLEIINETGVVGSCIFLLMVFFYFKNLAKLSEPHYGKWFIIAVLILNLQESTLFRQNITTGVLFLFFYMVLYIDILNKENMIKIRCRS